MTEQRNGNTLLKRYHSVINSGKEHKQRYRPRTNERECDPWARDVCLVAQQRSTVISKRIFVSGTTAHMVKLSLSAAVPLSGHTTLIRHWEFSTFIFIIHQKQIFVVIEYKTKIVYCLYSQRNFKTNSFFITHKLRNNNVLYFDTLKCSLTCHT